MYYKEKKILKTNKMIRQRYCKTKRLNNSNNNNFRGNGRQLLGQTTLFQEKISKK